ncbi:MAG: hypothetical protein KAT05_01285 [Spirochaetes bacterium]|nr:hypothetical protein [Spirochaetota bacterium]
MKKSKLILFVLIILVLFISFSFYSLSSLQKNQKSYIKLEMIINESNYCEIDDDCIEIEDPDLVFSCNEIKFVNKKEVENINKEIINFRSEILPNEKPYCNTIRDDSFLVFSVCKNNKCVEGESSTEDFGKKCINDSECEGFCVIENKQEITNVYNKYFLNQVLNKKITVKLNDFEEKGIKAKLVCSKNLGNDSCYPKFENGEYKTGWSKSGCVE